MSVNTLADENKAHSIANIVYTMTDQSSMVSVNLITDEKKAKYGNVKTPVEKNKSISMVNVNTVSTPWQVPLWWQMFILQRQSL